MGSREEPNWLLSVKGAEQGEAHVWEQEETWLFHSALNCSESPASKSCLVLGLEFPSNFMKVWEDEEDKYFSSLVMMKNDTLESLPYLLSLLSQF